MNERNNSITFSRRRFLLAIVCLGFCLWHISPANAYLPFEPFTFAYVTDVHLTNELQDSFILSHESQLFLQQLVKQLNADKVDFVMFGGDQVESPGKNDANWGLFCEILAGLHCPWSFVLGERDVSGDISVDKMRTYGSDWKDQGIKTSNSYWSMNPEFLPNVHIVGLDTSLPNTTIGGVSNRQLEWLKADLTENRKLFTMIFAHHPLLPPRPYDSGPPWDDYVIPDGGSVREILAVNPQVKLALSGHLHITRAQAEKDVWHLSNPSLTVFPCAYRIFRVTPQKVAMETRQIEFPALIKKARKALAESAIAARYSRTNPDTFVAIVEGASEDREALIPMIPGRQLEPYNSRKAAKERFKDSPDRLQQSQQTEQASDKTAIQPSDKLPEERKGFFRRKRSNNKTSPTDAEREPDTVPEDITGKPDSVADQSTQTTKLPGNEKVKDSGIPVKRSTGDRKTSFDEENSPPPPPARPEDIDKILEMPGLKPTEEKK